MADVRVQAGLDEGVFREYCQIKGKELTQGAETGEAEEAAKDDEGRADDGQGCRVDVWGVKEFGYG